MPINVVVPNKKMPGVYTSTDKVIEGLYIIIPSIYKDERGFFMESFNEYDFISQGIIDKDHPFVQDNESESSFGVLRGLHMQKGLYAQSKLVRVVHGKVLDVAVDVRSNSKTYGQWVAVVLADDNEKRQFYIPRGFLHGFVVLSETARFAYKCDNLYYKPAECGVRYDDPQININWEKISGIPTNKFIISEKDKMAVTLKELQERLR